MVARPGLVEAAPALDPQPGLVGVGVAAAEAEVAVHGHRRFAAEGAGPLPAALAEDEGDVLVEVEVVEAHAEQLAPAHPGVGQEADDGLVPAVLEILAGAVGEELAQVVLAEDGDGLFGDLGRRHAVHGGVVDLALVGEVAEELLEGPEAVRGRGRLVAGEDVGHEGLEVFPAQRRRLRGDPGRLQEPGQLGDGLEVGLDRAGGAVGSPQVPLGTLRQNGEIPRYAGLRRAMTDLLSRQVSRPTHMGSGRCARARHDRMATTPSASLDPTTRSTGSSIPLPREASTDPTSAPGSETTAAIPGCRVLLAGA
jgi:hypothetical protein